MNRETFINDDKTILNTDFYLYLLQKEIDAKKYKDVITATDYVELEKINDMIIKFNRDLLKENINLKKIEKEHQKINGELREENQKYKEVIDKTKSLNEEISHIIYEDFLEENVIGCKYLYERIKKQLDILKEVE